MPTKRRSAGLLMYRRRGASLEYLLVHPGGPFFAKKDLGAWSIPKGEYEEDEEPLCAAIREFEEETGLKAAGEFIPLGEIRQASGKLVTAWAFEGDCDETQIRSNLTPMGWPEVDRAGWFDWEGARGKILAAQLPLLERLVPLVERLEGPPHDRLPPSHLEE
jgi:predicted NUDIX family NTP pyrophosphohydrolase